MARLEQIVTNGRADYDSLQLRMQRRMSGGLNSLLNSNGAHVRRELHNLGIEEQLEESVTLIEWGEVAASALPSVPAASAARAGSTGPPAAASGL